MRLFQPQKTSSVLDSFGSESKPSAQDAIMTNEEFGLGDTPKPKNRSWCHLGFGASQSLNGGDSIQRA